MNFNELPIIIPNLEEVTKKIKKMIEDIKNAEDPKKASAIMKKYNHYVEDISSDMTVIQIRYSIDTTNEEYKEANEAVDNFGPYLSQLCIEFEQTVLSLPYLNDLKVIWGDFLFTKYENDIALFDEELIPLMVEENKLCSKYDAVIASAKIKFQGEVYNLSQMGKFSQSKDREIRKTAAKATEKFFTANNEQIGELYSQMVHLRTKMAQIKGYDNYIPFAYKSLGRVDYNADMVNGYREQLYTSLMPIVKKLHKSKIRRTGIKNAQFYDINLCFADGNPMPKGTTEEKVELAAKMYDEMSIETSEFFKFMRESNLMDLDAKPGKRGGGYMTYMPKYQAPFIFSNFNGTSGDIDVLTHEFGHAFQGYLSKDIKVPEYRSPTLEACEIHSMSMEFIAWPWMQLFFDNEAYKYKYLHLTDAINFLPYGALVDEFQHYVYENPNVSHSDRCSKWRELELKWLPNKKYSGFSTYQSGTWWLKQSHIFTSPFYYIDYTLAQVVAFEFLNESIKNPSKTWKKYVKLCKLGGKYPFLTLLEQAKLRNPFISGNVSKAIKPLTKILKELETKI